MSPTTATATRPTGWLRVTSRFRGPSLVIAIATALTSCSASQGYEAVRSAGEASAQCERRLTVEEQRRCEADYDRSFAAYRRQRSEALSDGDAHPAKGESPGSD